MEHTFEIRREHRTSAAAGELTWHRTAESLACFKGIWDEGVGISQRDLADLIAKKRRNGKCYFLSYEPGMLLPAAEKLLQHQQTKAEETRKYRLAIYGLVLSVLGLVAKLVYDHSK